MFKLPNPHNPNSQRRSLGFDDWNLSEAWMLEFGVYSSNRQFGNNLMSHI